MKMDISNDDLWQELYKELSPDIPWDKAQTIKQALEKVNEGKKDHQKIAEGQMRDTLERKCDTGTWKKEVFKSAAYYWPLDEEE